MDTLNTPENLQDAGPLTQVALLLQARDQAEKAARDGTRYGLMTYEMMVEVLLSDVPLTPEIRRTIAASINPGSAYKRRKKAAPKAPKSKVGRPKACPTDVWLVWATFIEDAAAGNGMSVKEAENVVMKKFNVKRSTLYSWRRRRLNLLMNPKPKPIHRFSVQKLGAPSF